MAPHTRRSTDSPEQTFAPQVVLNDAATVLMAEGGRAALTQEHVKEAVRLLTQRFVNAALDGEMDYLLAFEAAQGKAFNKRNGYGSKILHAVGGDFDIRIPRDRNGNFRPQLVARHSRRYHDFDDAVIELYGQGMSAQEVIDFVGKQYDVGVGTELIGAAEKRVTADVQQWQERPLEAVYPVVFFDVFRREDKKTAVHFALGVRSDGTREVLGLWSGNAAGAAFWTSLFADLKKRGVRKAQIAVTHGVRAMTPAAEKVFPSAQYDIDVVDLIGLSNPA